jgi:hypothetical protein
MTIESNRFALLIKDFVRGNERKFLENYRDCLQNGVEGD